MEDIPYVDGSWGENAAKFDKSVLLAEVLAIEPDVENEDDPIAKDDQSEIPEVNADERGLNGINESLAPEVRAVEGGAFSDCGSGWNGIAARWHLIRGSANRPG